ncbi:MAG: OmpA family protein [Xanthomonadales bacterium]|nr:OmpA family protein [Xanthomonadales bacterium]
MRTKNIVILSLFIIPFMLSGCATLDGDPNQKTKQGALWGALAGAAAGALIGDPELDDILIGAAIGAGLGAGVGHYMDKQEAELRRIEELEVQRIDEETLRVRFDSDILFAVNSAVLGGDSEYALVEFAGVMRDYPETAIVVQGYTDSTGSEEYNQKLSERRAQSVFNFMIGQDIYPERMYSVGYGESHPIADNSSLEGRNENRRVEILIRGKR